MCFLSIVSAITLSSVDIRRTDPSDDQHEESVKRTIVPSASSRILLVEELEKRTRRSDRSINGLDGTDGETCTIMKKSATDE